MVDRSRENVLIGTALFGLTAESGDRKLKKEYARLIKALPARYESVVRNQTSYYIQRYGMKVQGVTCARVKQPNSHLPTMKCLKQLEITKNTHGNHRH